MGIYKYSLIGLIWLLSITGLSYYSYNKGVLNEHNSLENKNKTILINQQQSIINNQLASIKLRDAQLVGFSDKLKTQQESYQQIQMELNNEKDNLDKSNKLTAKFVRLYNAAIRANSLYATNATAKSINAESDTVRASTALTIMNQNTQKCNAYIIQLNTLIDYIESQYQINISTYKNYNAKN